MHTVKNEMLKQKCASQMSFPKRSLLFNLLSNPLTYLSKCTVKKESHSWLRTVRNIGTFTKSDLSETI